jgi:hypothetical protein
MPGSSLAGCLASNLETHVECVPRPRQWGGFTATKPARMPLFYSGANSEASEASRSATAALLLGGNRRRVADCSPGRNVRIAQDWPFSDINRVSGRRPVLRLASLHLYRACFLCVRSPVRGPIILRSGRELPPPFSPRCLRRDAPMVFGNPSGMPSASVRNERKRLANPG